MNSELSRVLKKQFHKKMVAELPEFQKAGTELGGVIYRKHDAENGRYLFIFLEPNTKSDRFTLELAAATVPNFPFNLLPGEPGYCFELYSGHTRCAQNSAVQNATF